MNSKLISALVCASMVGVCCADVETPQDQGPQIAAEATEKSGEMKAEVFVPAEDAVKANLKKLGLHEGYDRQKKAIIAIGTSYYECKDPSADKNFMRTRSKKAMQAYLNAKGEIIRSILTEFSAMDKASVMSDEGDDSAYSVYQQKKTAFAGKKAAFVTKFSAVDEDEAKSLAAAPVDETLGATLDTLAMKLSTWSVKDEAKNKPALTNVLDELKADVAGLITEYKALDAESKKIAQTPTTELESTTTMISKMPLLGAAILTQTESWDKDEGVYSVSMAVVWSRKMQENAKRLCMGDFEPSAQKGKFSIHEWLDKQDLMTMVASRRMTDKEGKCMFVGIGAVSADVKAAKLTAAKRSADVEGFRSVAFALFGDVAAYTEAKSNLKEFAGDESTDTKYKSSEKLTDAVSQKIEKLNISGIQRGTSSMALHPITGKKAYVAAYYLEPDLAKDAMEILKKLYADSVLVTKASQYKAGVHAGQEKVLEETRASKAEFNRGMKEGEKAVKDAVRHEESLKAAKKISESLGAQGSGKKAKGKASGGTFTGDSDVDTNF